mmetsp:Transcript_66316/g.152095  ORF Transcript_66316/g.152095 Transcript_66316/m.152095 type:complete len:104 (+) Transcript_66316:107-418(+)
MAALRITLLVLLALPLARSQISSKACADHCFAGGCPPMDFDCMWTCVQGCPKGHAARRPIVKLSDLDDETRRRAISEMQEDQHRALALKKEKQGRSEQERDDH